MELLRAVASRPYRWFSSGRLVALEARLHSRRHREDEELYSQQVGCKVDRCLRICLRGDQVSVAQRDLIDLDGRAV